MFDIATRPLPASQATPMGVPFDWRLLTPQPAQALPWTDFTQPDGVPHGYVDVLATYCVELEPTLQTAIILSLFTDARASADDVLPRGVTDRRGWVGDEFMSPGDPWGSLYWLIYVSKIDDDVLEKARFYGQEALAWMVKTDVASRVVVTAEWVNDRLAVRPQIYQADQASPVYDVLWGTTIARGAA